MACRRHANAAERLYRLCRGAARPDLPRAVRHPRGAVGRHQCGPPRYWSDANDLNRDDDRPPVTACFDLSLSVDAHAESMAASGERAVAGVMSGVMTLEDPVTWR